MTDVEESVGVIGVGGGARHGVVQVMQVGKDTHTGFVVGVPLSVTVQLLEGFPGAWH